MKRIVYFILLMASFGASAQTVGIKVAAPVIKNNPSDNTVTGYSDLGNGGYHIRLTYHGRDSLITSFNKTLETGMICYVSGVDSTYRYNGTTWIPVPNGTTYTATSPAVVTGSVISIDTSGTNGVKNRAGANNQINTLASRITTNTSNIATNTSNIATNTSNITTNTTNIALKANIDGGNRFTGQQLFEPTGSTTDFPRGTYVKYNKIQSYNRVSGSTFPDTLNLNPDGAPVKIRTILSLPFGAANGKVLTSDAVGLATWQTPSGGGGSGNGYKTVFSTTAPTDTTVIWVDTDPSNTIEQCYPVHYRVSGKWTPSSAKTGIWWDNVGKVFSHGTPYNILVSGQSNTLSPFTTSFPVLDTLQDPHVTGWNHYNGKFEIGVLNKLGSCWELVRGENISHQLAKKISAFYGGRSVRVVMVAQGGTSLDAWSGNATGIPDTAYMYVRLKARCDSANIGHFDTFLWSHGDAGSSGDYYTQWIRFDQKLRTNSWCDSTTKVLVTGCGYPYMGQLPVGGTNAEIGLRRIGFDSDLYTDYVSVIGAEVDGSGSPHWTAAGHHKIAERAYETWLNLPINPQQKMLGYGSQSNFSNISDKRKIGADGIIFNNGITGKKYLSMAQDSVGFYDPSANLSGHSNAGLVFEHTTTYGNVTLSDFEGNVFKSDGNARLGTAGRWRSNIAIDLPAIDVNSYLAPAVIELDSYPLQDWYIKTTPGDNGNFVIGDPTLTGVGYLKVFADTKNVAIGDLTNNSAGQDITGVLFNLSNTTTKGVLMPRLTTAQRDAIPKGLLSLTVTSGGSGYTSQPATILSGGGATRQATIASPTMSGGTTGSVTGFNIGTVTSSGYTSVPTVTISGGGGTGATATANIGYPEGFTVYNTDTKHYNVYSNGAWTNLLNTSDAGGSGTVTSVTSANSDITVASTTTAPVLTLNSGTGANQIVKRDGSGNLNATTVTTNANLTGNVTSVGNATTIANINGVTPTYYDPTSSIQTQLNAKQATLVSGTSIKTINSASLLGSTNILLQTPLVAGTDYLAPTGSAASLTGFPTFNQNTTGSAATLTTARTINGVSFNGSANITVADATKLPLTGGTLSGNTTIANGFGSLILTVGPSGHAGYLQILNASSTRVGYIGYDNANMNYAVEIGKHLFTGGDLDVASNKITSLANGTSTNDAVNYGQLQASQTVKALFSNNYQQQASNMTSQVDLLINDGTVPLLPIGVVGKQIVATLGGTYSTPAITAGTLTVRVIYNGTTIASGTASGLLAGASGLAFDGNVSISTISVGTSGTVYITGGVNYSVANNAARLTLDLNNGGALATVNNSVAGNFEITAQWDTASTSKILNANVGRVITVN